MHGSPKLGKYYLLFGLLILLTAGALIYVLSQASAAKADKLTSSKVTEIAAKLQKYTSTNGQLPATLDDAGVNSLPPTVSYSRINDGQYKICVFYHLAGTSAGVNAASLLAAVLRRSLPAGNSPPSGLPFLDTYSLADFHKKGQTCQTVNPLGLGPSEGVNPANDAGSLSKTTATADKNSLLSAKCGTAGASYELKVETTLQAVDAGQGVLTLNTAAAKITNKNEAPINSLPSIKYDSLSSIYGASCKKLAAKDVDGLKAGAAMKIYMYSQNSTYADQIELWSTHSTKSLPNFSWITRLSGVQGTGEQRTELYMKYSKGAAQPATLQSAKSTSGAAGSASRQASAAGGSGYN